MNKLITVFANIVNQAWKNSHCYSLSFIALALLDWRVPLYFFGVATR
jgi:hypothetical protein